MRIVSYERNTKWVKTHKTTPLTFNKEKKADVSSDVTTNETYLWDFKGKAWKPALESKISIETEVQSDPEKQTKTITNTTTQTSKENGELKNTIEHVHIVVRDFLTGVIITEVNKTTNTDEVAGKSTVDIFQTDYFPGNLVSLDRTYKDREGNVTSMGVTILYARQTELPINMSMSVKSTIGGFRWSWGLGDGDVYNADAEARFQIILRWVERRTA